MNYNRILLILGHVLLWLFALDKLLALLTMNRYTFQSMGPDDYSIFSSRSAFIAWHVWGIIISVVTSLAMWRKQRMLFLISLLLLLVIQFYPWFTKDRGAGEGNTPVKTEQSPKS